MIAIDTTTPVWTELGGGEGLGNGGEQDAPPHGGAVEEHGEKSDSGGNKDSVKYPLIL